MKVEHLTTAEILEGYDMVGGLYPWIPSMITWRGWEYAAYRRFALPEPVLDVGCGDGRFFRLVVPDSHDVHGVEADPGVADAATRSGVYRHVHVSPAHLLPLRGERFGSAFANCSLEHMDRLPEVLRGIFESLEPGGVFLFSVVTDRFVEWSPVRLLLEAVGEPARGAAVQRQHEEYHHLVNALPVEGWVERLRAAGFEVMQHIPVLTEMTGRLFLLADQLWHVPREGAESAGELGDVLYPYLRAIPRFQKGFRQVLEGVLEMETGGEAIGAVLYARRPA
jgi:SAM-dependent methyltransferase